MLALSGSSIDDNDDDNVLKQIPEDNVTHHLCATDDLLSNFSALSALATPINENIRYVSWHGRVYFGFGGGEGGLQASTRGVPTCGGSAEILHQNILKSRSSKMLLS